MTQNRVFSLKRGSRPERSDQRQPNQASKPPNERSRRMPVNSSQPGSSHALHQAARALPLYSSFSTIHAVFST
jgi:hypothetical protein